MENEHRHKFQVRLDRDTAMVAGIDWFGVKTEEFTPSALTEEERRILASYKPFDAGILQTGRDTGEPAVWLSMKNKSVWESMVSIDGVICDPQALLLAAIKFEMKRRIEEEEKKKDRHEKTVAEILSRSIDENMADNPFYWPEDPRLSELKAARERLIEEGKERKKAEIEEKLNAAAREESAAKTRKDCIERKKRELIATAVRLTGNDSQRERCSEGALPDDEGEPILRDLIFAPMAMRPRYQRIKASEFACDCRNEFEGYAKFEAEDITEFPAEIWEDVKRARDGVALLSGHVRQTFDIESRMPIFASVRFREHQGWCAKCRNSAAITRFSALVTVVLKLGADPEKNDDPDEYWKLSREFAIEADSPRAGK